MDYKTTITKAKTNGKIASESTFFKIDDRFASALACSYESKNYNMAKTIAKQIRGAVTGFLCNENLSVLFTDNNPYTKMGCHYEMLKAAVEGSTLERVSLDKLSLAVVIIYIKTLQAFSSAHFDGRVMICNGDVIKRIYSAYNYGFSDITPDTKILVCNTEDFSSDIFETVKIQFTPDNALLFQRE